MMYDWDCGIVGLAGVARAESESESGDLGGDLGSGRMLVNWNDFWGGLWARCVSLEIWGCAGGGGGGVGGSVEWRTGEGLWVAPWRRA